MHLATQLNTFRDRGLALFVSITYENSRESLFGTTPARFTYRSVAEVLICC